MIVISYYVIVFTCAPNRKLSSMDPSPYAEQRYKDGLECAKRAVQYDQEGHYSGALSFYSEAVEALNHACAMAPVFQPIQAQVAEYSRRAEELNRCLKSTKPGQGLSSDPLNERCG